MRDPSRSIRVATDLVNAGKGASLQIHYIVVEPSQIVAQDLAHAIRAFDPKAEVRLLSHPADALAAVNKARPAAVFLHREPTSDQSVKVGLALRDAGVPIAFTGAEAEMSVGGAEVLDSPFTEATVAAILQRLLRQGASGAA
jgi:hypothetical protein